MHAPASSGSAKPFWSSLLVAAGILVLGATALLVDAGRGIFNSDAFARRVASSLNEPRVAEFVADRLTSALISQRPNLIAVRPLLSGTVEGLVKSAPFQAAAYQGLRAAHAALLSKDASNVLVSVPDVSVLLHSALAGANPELAAKVPEGWQGAIATLPQNRWVRALGGVRATWIRLRWLAITLLIIGPMLLVLGVALHPDRRRAMSLVGTALVGLGLVLALIIPAGRIVAPLVSADPLTRGAVFGMWRTYFFGMLAWTVTFCGTGLVLVAATQSMYERAHLKSTLRRVTDYFVSPPPTQGGRIVWTVVCASLGTILLLWPTALLTGAAICVGLLLVFAALRELFRLLLERAPAHVLQTDQGGRSRVLRLGIAGITSVALIGALLFITRPTAIGHAAGPVTQCNGRIDLCDRRLDEVAFAGAHNAMANSEAAGWMFPNHARGFSGQLDLGIRVLAVDLHYGFPGGERIQTELRHNESVMEVMRQSVGDEGMAAAYRIRSRIVHADSSHRGVYFCHGFCELGAYEAAPALAGIRDWLVLHPSEVIAMVIEDYVSPADMEAAFNSSGLSELVYRGPIAPWPTLGDLVAANTRVVVFLESGSAGVPWMHAAFENIQETPYAFHAPGEFNCRPNRGGTGGSLFQINHWIETTPTPKPSNAQIVNAHDFLLARARQCAAERKHRPNFIVVDFAEIGDVVGVADQLNREELRLAAK